LLEGFVEAALAALDRGVEDFEKLGDPLADIAPVFPGSLGDQVVEDVAGLEDARIVRKQAEEQPDKESLKVMPCVTGILERVVQPTHQFRGLDVDGVLVAEGALLDAKNESKCFDLLGQVDELELYRSAAFVEVIKLEVLEIADENVAGQFVLFESREIFQGLLFGSVEIPAGALLLD